MASQSRQKSVTESKKGKANIKNGMSVEELKKLTKDRIRQSTIEEKVSSSKTKLNSPLNPKAAFFSAQKASFTPPLPPGSREPPLSPVLSFSPPLPPMSPSSPPLPPGPMIPSIMGRPHYAASKNNYRHLPPPLPPLPTQPPLPPLPTQPPPPLPTQPPPPHSYPGPRAPPPPPNDYLYGPSSAPLPAQQPMSLYYMQQHALQLAEAAKLHFRNSLEGTHKMRGKGGKQKDTLNNVSMSAAVKQLKKEQEVANAAAVAQLRKQQEKANASAAAQLIQQEKEMARPTSIKTDIPSSILAESQRTLSPKDKLHQVSHMFRDGAMTANEKRRAKDLIIHDSLYAAKSPHSPSSSRHLLSRRPSSLLFLDAATSPPTSSPSWSPPARLKKSSNPASFFHQTQYESANNEQNMVVAPPPGYTRRTSMTVPWQVAESVFTAPFHGPTSSTNNSTSTASSSPHNLKKSSSSTLLNRICSEHPVESSSKTSSFSGSSSESTPSSAVVPPSGCPATTVNNASARDRIIRRGSFGNAAQFFRHRRRSKQSGSMLFNTLELSNLTPRPSPRPSDTASDTGSVTSSHGSKSSHTSESLGPPLHPRSNISSRRMTPRGSFRTLASPMVLSSASPSSSTYQQQLPVMSPNAEKLRQVATLTRHGSYSAQDKRRAKNDIISQCLGTSAGSNVALIGKLKLKMSTRLTQARRSLELQESQMARLQQMSRDKGVMPPPGFVFGKNTRASSRAASPKLKYSLEQRMASTTALITDCIARDDMVAFGTAMETLDELKKEAQQVMKR